MVARRLGAVLIGCILMTAQAACAETINLACMIHGITIQLNINTDSRVVHANREPFSDEQVDYSNLDITDSEFRYGPKNHRVVYKINRYTGDFLMDNSNNAMDHNFYGSCKTVDRKF